MSWYLTFPIVIPFLTAVLAFLYRGQPASAWISVTGSAIGLFSALTLFSLVNQQGVLAGQMGGWAAPFGITLVADLLSALLVTITAAVGLAVAVYSVGEIDERLSRFGYFALFQVLLAGVSGAFLTGDLFNLYVWFEVMLISSFGLLILGGRPAQIDGAVKYVTVNLVSTILFLSGIGMLYGVTGTLNMADLSRTVAASPQQGLLNIIAVMFLVAFGVKAAVFPLFFWLPASYHTPAFAVSAVFAALLTKVGVYSLFRTFTLILPGDTEFINELLLWVAGLTMLTGALGAIAQSDIRRILSFQVISSIGFLIMGLALDSPLALAGAVFYLLHTMLVKAALFMSAGVVERLCGSSQLSQTGGLYRTAPMFGVLFLIPAFSLGGIPPLSGFWPKILLVKAGLDQTEFLIAAIALLAGLLTIYSMVRVWSAAFWSAHPEGLEPRITDLGSARPTLMAPLVALAIAILLIGLYPQPIFEIAERAANQLLSPDAYMTAVLGDGS